MIDANRLARRAHDLLLDGEQDSPLFAVLDGAQDARIHAQGLTAGVPCMVLYAGKLGPALTAAAPRLVELRGGQAFAEWLFEEGWGQSWGILLRSAAPMKELRKHLRTFLMVKTEDGDKLYFRYYDPRVLRAYLPTCTREELAQVFGPIEEFLVEGEEPDRLVCYGRDGAGGLTVREEPLAAPAAEEAPARPRASARLAAAGLLADAPAVPGRRTGRLRTGRLAAPIAVEDALQELRRLRAELVELRDDAEAAQAKVPESYAALGALLQRVEATPNDADPRVVDVRKHLSRLHERLGRRKDLQPQAITAGLTTLLVSLGAHREG